VRPFDSNWLNFIARMCSLSLVENVGVVFNSEMMNTDRSVSIRFLFRKLEKKHTILIVSMGSMNEPGR